MPRQPADRWSHAQGTKNQLRLWEPPKIPADQALHLWWAPQTMSATYFDKAFGGSAANHHAPRPTWRRAKDCSQNPAAPARQGPALGIAECRYLADREHAHPAEGQNSSNRDAEN